NKSQPIEDNEQIKTKLQKKPIEELQPTKTKTREQETVKPVFEEKATKLVDTISIKEENQPTKKEVEKPTKTIPVVEEIDCENVSITTSPKIKKPCIGESNGTVTFVSEKISGG